MAIETINGKTYDVWNKWKELPKDYKCPCCNREKKHIARPNKNGHIMCHITEIGVCMDCVNSKTDIKKIYGLDISFNKLYKYITISNNNSHTLDYRILSEASIK